MTPPNNPPAEVSVANEAGLLACPFCGGEAHDSGHISYSRPLEDTWWADSSPVQEAFFCSCISCGSRARGGVIGGHRTKAEAITAWNTRTPASEGCGRPAVSEGGAISERGSSTSEAVPAGWRLVPVEPTEGMVRAAQRNDRGGLVTPDYRRAIYHAMLSASPTPSTPEASEQVEALRGRPFSEWSEDHGEVLWWKLPIVEAPYCGSPLDLGRSMKVDVRIGLEHHEFPIVDTGGWPFDEQDAADLWWTPLPNPTFARATLSHAEEGGK